MVKVLKLSVGARWKRLGLLLLLGVVLVWALLRCAAQIRGTRTANVVGDIESLNTALAYDPAAGEVHTRLGSYYLSDPTLFDLTQAVHHFEAAVHIHPFDWSAWSNLGYAYEQQGAMDRAERAYLTGIECAPNYFYPRWLYGNFLLRRRELKRAFGQFRQVADSRPEVVSSICELIWQTTGGRAEALVEFASDLRAGYAKGGVCQCLLTRREYQQAVRVWATALKDDPAQLATGRSLVSALSAAGQWPLAHHVWREVVRKQFEKRGAISPAELVFWNGDFEYEVAVGAFDWSMNSSPEVEATLDPSERFRGNRSLLLDFKRHQMISFSGVTHDLWVDPSTGYRLRFYYKTERVPQANGLAVVLSDAEAPTRFSVQSTPLENRDQWTSQEIVFEAPAETRILRLQIVRRPVGLPYDYMKGRVWFDSFSLEATPNGHTRSHNTRPDVGANQLH